MLCAGSSIRLNSLIRTGYESHRTSSFLVSGIANNFRTIQRSNKGISKKIFWRGQLFNFWR